MSKILFVASAGGHFSELMQMKKTMNIHDSIIVTEGVSSSINNKDINYFLKYGTRSRIFKYIFIFIYNFFLTIKILFKEKPDCIISTGAHSCVSFFILGKLFKCKLVYIESFAKVNRPSLTYKIIHNFCDVIYVQHKEMLEVYKDAIYIGGLY
ncbi:MAG: PssD/Cps14F family polysaccharide biosynthesis glycosyltransferase [Mycoplasmatales bacterium]